jgi:hypothetical protein
VLDMTRERLPELVPWLAKRPLRALEHAAHWSRVLEVLLFFRAHPSPGVFLRQLEIPGVDTKFIELRRSLFGELLPEVTAPLPGNSFEVRFGLATKPALLRFRILDSEARISGLSDLSVPFEQFAALRLTARRVFITENELNGLCFPPVRDSIVIFGLGYGVEQLAGIEWLRGKDVSYWGDIDTHGFAILDRLRAFLPDARSLLMDRETLMAHREAWVEEPVPHLAPLSRLDRDEQALFEDLVGDRVGRRVRLEQERVRFGVVRRAVASRL